MEEEKKVIEDKIEVKKAVNSPKTSRAVWNEIKIRFESGSYLSLEELSKEYGINPITLRTRMFREKWNEKQRTLQNKVELVIEAKVLSLAEKQASYLERLGKRSFKYEQIIDASIAQLSTTNEGVPLCDPDQIDSFTKSESRISELSRVAYRIPTLSNQDITSGGKDLAASFVSAIAALRDSQATPKLTSQDLKSAIDAEIV